MTPPKGQTTFTSLKSLEYAHKLRKKCDAILTGSGTILADTPRFTIRLIPDHHNRQKRWLAYMDRRNRVPLQWINKAENNFQLYHGIDLKQTLQFLGKQGCLQVLVEAGKTLSNAIINEKLHQELITIHHDDGQQEDIIFHEYQPIL